MRLRHTTAIALAASIACHASLMALAVWFGGYDVVADSSRGPVMLAQASPVPRDDPLGKRGGRGEAIADFDALQSPQSPHDAQDQPLLGLAGDGPLRDGAPQPSQLLAAVEPSASLPAGESFADLSAAVATGRLQGRTPNPPEDTVAAQMPAIKGAGSPQAAPRELASNTPATPTTPAATDPGPSSEREVDLFTQEASADYRAGQTVAREGREFKIRGLRRGLAAFFEQAFLPRPITVRYRIKVDAQGTPVLIEIAKSSGSELLDQTIRKDLFNSWFDPDPTGDGRDAGKPFYFSLRIE